MTNEQIKFIVTDVLKDEMDALTPLTNCSYIVLDSDNLIFPKQKQYLFKFVSSKNILEIYPYKLHKYTDKIVIDNNRYILIQNGDSKLICEFPIDKYGKRIVDYVDFEAIVIIKVGGNI